MQVSGIAISVWLGVFALFLFAAASGIAVLIKSGAKIPLSWHVWAARIGIVFALAHAALMLLAYL